MVVGILGAIAQEDIKRIFSFYIISQIGYIIMGLGLPRWPESPARSTPSSTTSSSKTTLFLVGGLIEHAGGTSRLNRLGNMVTTAPFIAVLFLLPGAEPGRVSRRSRASSPSSDSSTPPHGPPSGRSWPSV